jgi:hypothetical protein
LSAVKLLVTTWNCVIESGFGRMGVKFEPPALVSLMSMPSSVKLKARSRAPWTWMPPPVFEPVTTPGWKLMNSSGFRPRLPTMGSASSGRSSMVLPKLPEVEVCTSSADACTVTVSAMLPASRVTSMVAGWFTLTWLLDETNFLKPVCSTASV